mmetsp:Transcript_45260/g.113938  ORF Transcript_45260/g.113938 Transcript_45260/m.113938 type:complete len:232 (+) Transcript_45260:775-1470(+)
MRARQTGKAVRHADVTAGGDDGESTNTQLLKLNVETVGHIVGHECLGLTVAHRVHLGWVGIIGQLLHPLDQEAAVAHRPEDSAHIETSGEDPFDIERGLSTGHASVVGTNHSDRRLDQVHQVSEAVHIVWTVELSVEFGHTLDVVRICTHVSLRDTIELLSHLRCDPRPWEQFTQVGLLAGGAGRELQGDGDGEWLVGHVVHQQVVDRELGGGLGLDVRGVKVSCASVVAL